MTDKTTTPAERLGMRAAARRAELGLSQADLAARAEVSMSTVQVLERGRQESFRKATIGSLERALGWKPGSMDAISRGEEPSVLEPVTVGGPQWDWRVGGTSPVESSTTIRYDTEAHAAEVRLAAACDQLGAGLSPLAERLGKLVAEGIDEGPPAVIAVAALEQLLGRLQEFNGAIEDLHNELLDARNRAVHDLG